MASEAAQAGVEDSQIRAQGLWATDAMNRCYQRGQPLDLLLAAAGFDQNKPELHFLVRDSLGALATVWSWRPC
jgi:hypothetical protein